MGKVRRDALRVGFDCAIKLEFHGATVSSGAGLFPYRDLDEAVQVPAAPVQRLVITSHCLLPIVILSASGSNAWAGTTPVNTA